MHMVKVISGQTHFDGTILKGNILGMDIIKTAYEDE